MYPACPIFTEYENGIIFMAYQFQTYRQGLLGCMNRSTKLYHLKNTISTPKISDNKIYKQELEKRPYLKMVLENNNERKEKNNIKKFVSYLLDLLKF